ncbi:putative protoheme IX farnesyltransferase [Mycobacterium xenopi 4042]|uniref:Protoheme IX farnesyltransferase n=1 Tax=Mycobacterium xenopi 4042 TaxID=1299334 RepID=X7YPD7_MYCXE|nr:putative protoheme IX farnesyltransferase [Mycobacterium xenopi 4042]
MGGWLHAGDDRLVGGHGHHRLAGAGDVRDHLLLDPPHTWALAMRYRDDYKAAGVPMLPAVATEREVTGRILVYTWLTVFATLVLALSAGWLYATVAVLAGVWFLAMAHQLYAGFAAASRSSRCGYSCSRTTTWRCCSVRWRLIRC